MLQWIIGSIPHGGPIEKLLITDKAETSFNTGDYEMSFSTDDYETSFRFVINLC